MNGLKTISLTLCYTCVAVSMITVLIPQKRTRRIMSFVIGLFFISTFITAVSAQMNEIDFHHISANDIPIPTYSEEDGKDIVIQMTADHLTQSLNELLCNEGITPQNIQLTLKKTDEDRISVVRAVIYISEADRDNMTKIKSIVYRNVSKEPEIYVAGEETQHLTE